MKTRPRAIALAGALTAALVPVTAGAARAETTPTSIELLTQCDNGTDSCVFHPNGAARASWTATDLVGQTANCTTANQDASVGWTRTTFSANSVGVSLKVIAGATKEFMNGFKIAYGHEWTETRTDTDTTKITIPPRSMGRVYHARELETVDGTYELHFGYRFHGHYYWYVPFTMTSPKSDGTDHVTTVSSPLTAQEAAAYCG